MRTLLFALLYSAPFLLLLMYRDRHGAHVFKVSCANTLMLFYLLYGHLGLLLMYRSPDGIKQLPSVNLDTVVLLAAYSLVVTLAFIGSGLVLGGRFVQIRVPDLARLRAAPINWFPLVLTVILVTPIALWKVMAQSPLLLLLSGDAAAALDARVAAVSTNTHFLGIKPSYLNILWVLLGFVQVIAFIIALTRRRLGHILFLVFVTIVFTLEQFSGVSKGVIIGPMYIILFSYALLYRKGSLMNKAMAWAVVYVFAIVAAFSAWAAGLDVVSMWYPFERLFLGNLLPQYVVVDRFGFGNLLLGATAPSWFSLGNHQQFLLDVFAWREIMQPKDVLTFYTAPSSFVAELHANFHFIGVVLGSAVIFIVLRGVDYLIRTVRSELMYTALMVSSSLHFSKMAASGVVSYIVDYYYWTMLLFALVAYRLSLFWPSTPPRAVAAAAEPDGGGAGGDRSGAHV